MTDHAARPVSSPDTGPDTGSPGTGAPVTPHAEPDTDTGGVGAAAANPALLGVPTFVIGSVALGLYLIGFKGADHAIAALLLVSPAGQEQAVAVLRHVPELRDATDERLANSADLVETAIKEYADFLPVPIYLNGAKARANVINVAWFDPTPDPEAVELALEDYFGETPLDVLPLRLEKPVAIAGALYITPQRVPGFSGHPVVTATLRRMVISRKIQGLIPSWASFVRGVLELSDCAPTASREDLVRVARELLCGLLSGCNLPGADLCTEQADVVADGLQLAPGQ